MSNYIDTYNTYKLIVDNAPEWAVLWDGEDYLDYKMRKSYKIVSLHRNSLNGDTVMDEKLAFQDKLSINTLNLRSIEDLREIVRLKEIVMTACILSDRIDKLLSD